MIQNQRKNRQLPQDNFNTWNSSDHDHREQPFQATLDTLYCCHFCTHFREHHIRICQIPQVRHDNKHLDRHAQKWGILSFISIQYQFNLHDQIFLIFFKTKLLMINLKMEHCGAFYAPSCHICKEFKKKWKISNYSINFF